MKRLTILIALLVGAGASPDIIAAPTPACVADAARYHHVSPRLLQAIATVESGNDARALNQNGNGTSDIGLMQINTAWLATLARFGVSRTRLFDPCVNVYVGAWILSRNIARLGLTWNAIGAYNALDPTKRVIYARKVYQALMTSATDASTNRLFPAAPAPARDTASRGPRATERRKPRPVEQSTAPALVAWEANP
jgi:soluble lytic murein transglycosylase-like protein